MSKGKFITLEGGEGAGKSTQAKRLQSWLAAQGLQTLLTREPGGTVEAEEIRRILIDGATDRWDPLTETLLHFSARRVHLDRAILPALAQSRWVICDRFADSTMAYQGYGLKLGAGVVSKIYDIVVGDFAPDLTIILDLPVEVASARLAERGERLDRYERRDAAFHQRVRDGFREIATAAPLRCLTLDADQDEDKLAQSIIDVVVERLGGNVPNMVIN